VITGTMKADLDFDIVAHFGYFRNVDLLSKGLYVVQVRLYYGLEGNLIAPVGMFSSPSTVCSIVQDQTVMSICISCSLLVSSHGRTIPCSYRPRQCQACVKWTTTCGVFAQDL
jgi:hypothetical protein